MLVRCSACRGGKIVTTMGGMTKPCLDCKGHGHVIKLPEPSPTPVVKLEEPEPVKVKSESRKK